jgi:hypothetical protein
MMTRCAALLLLTATGVAFLLWEASPTAWGQEQEEVSLSDVALQAAGGLVGSAIGTTVGAVSSVPLVLQLTQSLPPCLEKVGRFLREGEPVDEDEPQQAAALGLCLAQAMVPVSLGSGLVIAGGSLGTVVGIALVAQAQGRSGNLLAASLGVLVGNALSFYGGYRLMLAEFPKIEEEVRRGMGEHPREGISFSFDPKAMVESLAWSLLPVVLGVLAFNFL